MRGHDVWHGDDDAPDLAGSRWSPPRVEGRRACASAGLVCCGLRGRSLLTACRSGPYFSVWTHICLFYLLTRLFAEGVFSRIYLLNFDLWLGMSNERSSYYPSSRPGYPVWPIPPLGVCNSGETRKQRPTLTPNPFTMLHSHGTAEPPGTRGALVATSWPARLVDLFRRCVFLDEGMQKTKL